VAEGTTVTITVATAPEEEEPAPDEGGGLSTEPNSFQQP
jgi:hypothetical protein